MMIYTFFALENYFALDVESGSVFLIDKLTHILLSAKSGADNAAALKEFSAAEIAECNAEIDALIKEGILFSDRAEWDNTAAEGGVIKAICLNICHDCNLACGYCFAEEGVSQKSKMSFETAKAACDFLLSKSGTRKNIEVDFFGGEPLLNFEVVQRTAEYLKERAAAHRKNVKLTITTNALALTKERADWLNDNMSNVVISIDGRKGVHNQVRKTLTGADAFDVILSNAKYFRSIRGNRDYYIRGTYTAKNLDFWRDALAVRDYGFDQISLEPVVLEDSHPLAIRQLDLDGIEESYATLAKIYLEDRKTDDKWFNFFHFMLDLNAMPCEKKLLNGCGAGCDYVAVTPDGGIYPCHQFAGKSEYRMGNVTTGEFDSALSRVFSESNLLTKPACKECWAKYYCSGGCVSNNISFGGGVDACYETSCAIVKTRLKYALALAALETDA